MQVCVYSCTYVCMFACIPVCICICVCICMHVCMYVCMHVCMYVGIHVCTHVLCIMPCMSVLGPYICMCFCVPVQEFAYLMFLRPCVYAYYTFVYGRRCTCAQTCMHATRGVVGCLNQDVQTTTWSEGLGSQCFLILLSRKTFLCKDSFWQSVPMSSCNVEERSAWHSRSLRS